MRSSKFRCWTTAPITRRKSPARPSRNCAALGYPIRYIHRDNRQGYKAGALAAGLKQARGEFIAIFDADFIPPKDIFYNVVDYFTDPKIGMVQVRWDHLNRNASLLTKSQAIFLDGHFVIEHTARNRSGRFMHFNGTAGVWRRNTIDDAGGWQHDTLTEDLDLSYRANEGLAVRLSAAVRRPGRAAAGNHRIQAAGPSLDQGFLPDRHQASAAHPEVEASADADQDRGVFPPHLHRGLPADGGADAADVSQSSSPSTGRSNRRHGRSGFSAAACSSWQPARPALFSCSPSASCSAGRQRGDRCYTSPS